MNTATISAPTAPREQKIAAARLQYHECLKRMAAAFQAVEDASSEADRIRRQLNMDLNGGVVDLSGLNRHFEGFCPDFVRDGLLTRKISEIRKYLAE